MAGYMGTLRDAGLDPTTPPKYGIWQYAPAGHPQSQEVYEARMQQKGSAEPPTALPPGGMMFAEMNDVINEFDEMNDLINEGVRNAIATTTINDDRIATTTINDDRIPHNNRRCCGDNGAEQWWQQTCSREI